MSLFRNREIEELRQELKYLQGQINDLREQYWTSQAKYGALLEHLGIKIVQPTARYEIQEVKK
jgi:hypothetical protein